MVTINDYWGANIQTTALLLEELYFHVLTIDQSKSLDF